MNAFKWAALAVVFAGTVAASFFDAEGETPAVFYAIFGAVGCLLLLFLAKIVGKPLLTRKEDYYDAR